MIYSRDMDQVRRPVEGVVVERVNVAKKAWTAPVLRRSGLLDVTEGGTGSTTDGPGSS